MTIAPEPMVTITAALTHEEAVALAKVIRVFSPRPEIATAWYGALDKLSPQLPTSGEGSREGCDIRIRLQP